MLREVSHWWIFGWNLNHQHKWNDKGTPQRFPFPEYLCIPVVPIVDLPMAHFSQKKIAEAHQYFLKVYNSEIV